MNIRYRKKFLKELARLPSSIRTTIESFVFTQLPILNSISESKNIEKLKGYDQYYKVRFGNYRVGLFLDDDTLFVERVLHRKDIYKYFP